MSVGVGLSRPRNGLGKTAITNDGKTYTRAGLKPGSTATLFAGGTQIASVVVNVSGQAIWNLSAAPAGGAVMEFDGQVHGSAGTAPTPATPPVTAPPAGPVYVLWEPDQHLPIPPSVYFVHQPDDSYSDLSGNNHTLTADADRQWNSDNFVIPQPCTVVIGFHEDANPTGYEILVQGAQDGRDDRFLFFTRRQDFGGEPVLNSGNNVGITKRISTAGSHGLILVLNGDNSLISIDGVRETHAGAGSRAITHGLRIGGGDSGSFFNGEVATLLVIPGVVSGDDLTKLEGWIERHGGDVAQLPLTQPYASLAPTTAPIPAAEPAPPVPGRMLQAPYLGYGGDGRAKIADFERMLGRPIEMVQDHGEKGSWDSMVSSAEDAMNHWAGCGKNMCFSLPVVCSGTALDQIPSGQFDTYHRKTLAAIRDRGGFTSPYIRLGWEINLGWRPEHIYSFGGSDTASPANFIAAYEHIAAIIREEISTARIMFNVNKGYGLGPWTAAVPKRKFIDILTMDAYNDGYADDEKLTGEARFNKILRGADGLGLDKLAEIAAALNVPMAIPEFGSGWCNTDLSDGPSLGGDMASFVTLYAAWMKSHSVDLVGWFEAVDGNQPTSYNSVLSQSSNVTGVVPSDLKYEKPNMAAAYKAAFQTT